MLKSGVSEGAHMLKQRLISELSLAELVFCLRQDIATAPVAARALGALADDPLLEAEGGILATSCVAFCMRLKAADSHPRYRSNYGTSAARHWQGPKRYKSWWYLQLANS